MKLDVTCMRYLSKDDYRVLVSIEMGMRNHEMVPVELITSIAKLRHGGIHKILSTLLRYKLVAHTNNEYNGYRLSYMGFDILALRALLGRGVVTSVGRQIGVGKESDIFEAMDETGNEIVLKFHRLGRTSFRAVRRQRDYMQGRNKASWLYMSRLAAIKEYAFMKALHANGFPTPIPIDQSRHVVAMSKVPGFPMSQIKAGKMEWAEEIFAISLGILKRLAEHGLVHCDLNEFNLMVDETGHVTLIDFPQMISTSHINAADLFARDLHGLVKFFAMKMRYIPPDEMLCKLSDIVVSNDGRIDESIKASGFSHHDDDILMRFIIDNQKQQQEEAEGNDDDDENDSSEIEESIPIVDNDMVIEDVDGDTSKQAGNTISHPAACLTLLSQEFDDGEVAVLLANVNEAVAEFECGRGQRVGEGDGGEEEEEIVGNSDDDGSLTGSEEGNDNPTLTIDKRRVQERTKNDLLRRKGSGKNGQPQGSRNMTKKRTKYGKIDRIQKMDAW